MFVLCDCSGESSHFQNKVKSLRQMIVCIDTNHDQRHKYHHLTTTLHLTLKMTTAQVVETSVTNNSLSKDDSQLHDHARQTIITMTIFIQDSNNLQLSSTGYSGIFTAAWLRILMNIVCVCHLMAVLFI